ncbi:MAG: SHOCT domain-containing protein [Nanoarchaeota archaeon]|nr:SHOCT domain-containing protein [Nanoarchaeota archaeon]
MEQNKNVWIWVLVALALLLSLGSFGMGGYGMMGYGMGFGWIFMFLFLGGLIWLIYSLVNAAQSNTHQEKEEDAKGILKKRYVKGEISKKRYEEMRKELSK